MEKFKKMLKRKIQLTLSKILNTPEIPEDKTTGFSLVESQIAKVVCTSKTKIYYPCKLIDITIGDYTYIASNANIHNTIIGKFCSIGPNFCCGLGIHPTNGISTSPMFYSTLKQNGVSLTEINKVVESKRVIVENDVFIGANVTVLDGAKIGNGAIIGAGAVVAKDIPPYAIAVGVPAKVVKYRFTEEHINNLMKIQWWNFEDEKLQNIEELFFNIDLFIERYSE